MERTSDLPEDFKARLRIIEESTAPRVKIPEIKQIAQAIEALERTSDRDSRELLNALNRAAGEIVKLRTVDQAGNEKLEAAFSREVAELNGAFTDVVRALTELPALIPKTDTKGIESGLEAVKKTIEDKDTAPKVEVPTPVVNIDLKELKKDVKKVEDAIKAIEIPEVEIPEQKDVDLEPMMAQLKKANDTLKGILERPMPVSSGGGQHAFRSTDGTPTTAELDADGNLKVSIEEVDGGAVIPINQAIYKTIIDDTTTTNVTYIGQAALGTATSASSWRIQKIDESGTNTVITWTGSGFDAVFDNRVTETYS